MAFFRHRIILTLCALLAAAALAGACRASRLPRPDSQSLLRALMLHH